ncbi:MAG: hypothetical protein DMF68_04530 [Acidobacteria bacterium]|nr:MAG: hypothetical protein DMF68_04530 [Acidobacteriota bacterium]
MSKRNLIRLFLAFLLFSVHVQASDKISKETIASQGRKRTYYLFVPASTESKTDVPLVVLLHGSGRNGLSLVEKWKDLASEEGFIVVGPDASDSEGWRMPEDGPDFIHDLVESLRAKYPINPKRIYLFGHSAGAVFAINLSMMESEYFAATAIHAGSWREREEFALLNYAKRKTPLAIFVGDHDQYFSLSSVHTTEAALKEKGFTIEVTVMKGHDHWYYDLAPEINRNAWTFLKRYELNSEPKYEAYNFTGASEDVNAAVKEINALRAKFNENMRLFMTKEAELRMKSYEKASSADVAREQIKIAAETADAMRQIALRAVRTSKLKLQGNYSQYFSTLAESFNKRAEALEIMRERAALLLSDEPQTSVTTKMNDAAVKAERLNLEADELEQRAEKIRTGQKL